MIQVEILSDAVRAELARSVAGLQQRAMQALYLQMQRTLTKAIRYTPIKTGTLRGTGQVRMAAGEAEIVFGGTEAPYATYVHENLYVKHPVGQAKYLERAVTEDAKKYERILIKAIDPNVRS